MHEQVHARAGEITVQAGTLTLRARMIDNWKVKKIEEWKETHNCTFDCKSRRRGH